MGRSTASSAVTLRMATLNSKARQGQLHHAQQRQRRALRRG